MLTLLPLPFPPPISHQLNDVPAAKALIAFSCEVNSLNPEDLTPLDIATQKHPDGEILTLLASVGGQTGRCNLFFSPELLYEDAPVIRTQNVMIFALALLLGSHRVYQNSAISILPLYSTTYI